MALISTPHEAELNAERHMRMWGYFDAVATTGGADGGIDVRSNRALAQVKFRGSRAGRPDVQRLVGAAAGDSTKVLLFFDYRGYSPQAVQYANQMGVGLYVYDTSGVVKPVNQSARQIMVVSPGDQLVAIVSSPQVRWIGLMGVGTVLALVLIAMAVRQL